MLFPKKVKHRKWQSARKNVNKRGVESRGVDLQYGSFGLKAISQHRVTSNQIESARKVVTREVGKFGKYWVRVFPDRPVTAKAAEVGMGKGKGDPKGFCVDILPGRILFEVDNLSPEMAREALRKAGTKLPIKTRIVDREDMLR